MILATLAATVNLASAHLLGTAPWCVANSPTHYECFFYDFENCEKAAARRTDQFERWECVSYPPNFAALPKVGEGSGTPTPSPTPSPTPISSPSPSPISDKPHSPSGKKTP